MIMRKKTSYSKHHAAERWDLEFGSNTTEKFENSLKNLKTHEAQVFLNVCLVRILICEVEESALSNVLEREGRSLWLRPVLISD